MSDPHPYSARFSITGDPQGLRTALLALQPEMGITSRSSVEAEIADNELHISINAADVVALRAAVNSFLRWLNEALEIFEGTRIEIDH